jgi:SAM-dependent methyltransferase
VALDVSARVGSGVSRSVSGRRPATQATDGVRMHADEASVTDDPGGVVSQVMDKDDESYQHEYNEIYKRGQQKSLWPWSDLASKVTGLRQNLPRNPYVLELGCGYGANILFLQELSPNYYSIEFSTHTVSFLQQEFPHLKNNIVVGDFAREIPFDLQFDLVVDRAALVCNSTNEIRNCILNLQSHMKTGSYFVGIDWYSTNHQEYARGVALVDDLGEDKYTKLYSKGNSYFDPPKMHFCDREHLEDLFVEFEFVSMEEKDVNRFCINDSPAARLSSINFVCRLK